MMRRLRRTGRLRRRDRRGAPPRRPALAGTPIKSYSAIPSSTQAGGHPDLEVLLGRKPGPPEEPKPLQLRGRQRRQHPSAGGLHRQPARDPAVHGRPVLRRRMPGRLAGRGSPTCSATNGDPLRHRRLQHRAAARRRRAARLQDLPLRHAAVHGPRAPAPAATTGSTPTPPRSSTGSSRWKDPAGALGRPRRSQPRPPADQPAQLPRRAVVPRLALRRKRQLATRDPESVDEFCIGNFVGFTPLHSNALSARSCRTRPPATRRSSSARSPLLRRRH